MAIEFKLPDIGEGLTEGEIVKWLVAPGDTVKEDQPMVEVMTDKANVEIPSPAAGIVQKILAKEGQVVKVGTVIIVIGEGAVAASTSPAKSEVKPAPTKTSAVPPPATTPAPSKEKAKSIAPAPGNGGASPMSVPTVPPPVGPVNPVSIEKVLASPATRKLARDRGIDLSAVRGTGPHGRVTREDVMGFSGAPAGTAAAPSFAASAALGTAGSREERVPLKGLRRKISEKMVKSKRTAPHFTYVDEVDMSEVVYLRKSLVEKVGPQGPRISFLAFVVKALIPALQAFPMVNASLDDEKEEILLKRYYNIGIAVATPEGLTVPVIKEADRKDILQLSVDIQRLSEAARARKLTLDEMKDGTFTITSTGNIGGILATPIINHPEVAILGVHKISQRPVVRDGQIVIRDIAHLSISLDHRVVDGAVGAEFMNLLIRNLEHPGLLML